MTNSRLKINGKYIKINNSLFYERPETVDITKMKLFKYNEKTHPGGADTNKILVSDDLETITNRIIEADIVYFFEYDGNKLLLSDFIITEDKYLGDMILYIDDVFMYDIETTKSVGPYYWNATKSAFHEAGSGFHVIYTFKMIDGTEIIINFEG